MYSSGMFARLAFSVAINVEPDVLIVDEALSVGDIAFQNKCAIRMDYLKNNGVSILLVSHSMSEIKKLCTRAIYLKNGQIHAIGKTKDVCHKYESELYGRVTPKIIDEQKISAKIKIDEQIKEIPISDFFEKNKDISRSGTGEAEIFNVVIMKDNEVVENINVGDNITVRIYVKYKQDINSEGIIGYMFQDSKGQGIIGYNIWNYGELLPPMKKGDILIFDFISKNILSPGEYTISLGVRGHWSPKKLQFLDFIQVAAKIEVMPIKDNYVSGLVYNKHDCQYKIIQ